MIRALFNFLLGIRKLIQRWGTALFNKFRDPQTGKLTFVSPKNLGPILMIAGGVFFLAILLSQIFGGNSQIPGGLDKYREEMQPKLGIGSQEQNYKGVFSDDPLNALNSLKNAKDPLEDLKKLGPGGGSEGSSGSGSSASGEEGALPSISDCLDLIEKMKTGVVLSADDQEKAKICVDQNIAGLSAEELAMAKKLLDPNISEAEKELLRKALRGDLDSDSAEARLAQALAKNEAGAKEALAALEAKNQELLEALLKQMDGKDLSPEETSLVDSFKKLVADQASKNSLDNPEASSNREEASKQLAADIAAREAALRDLEAQMKAAQEQARIAAEKVARGEKLSESERAALAKLTELQKKQAELAALQEKRKAALARLLAELQKTLTSVSLTMQQTFPSGVSVEIDENLIDCNKIKPVFKRVAKKKTTGTNIAKRGDKEVWLDQNGEALTPDKIRLIKLLRKQKADEAKAIAGVKNPFGETSGGAIGERLDVNQVMGEEGVNVDISTLTVFADKSLKSFNLTPDMKIPAVLESEILVSDKGQGQMVRVRIIDDVHNPENGQLVIPKGAIAIAQASGFDPDTGVIDLNFDKVTVGSGKVLQVKLSVGSADGTMGLRGQVRDTRGKFLLGAFITSFSAGALNWFSQSVIQPFQTATDAGNALLGAGLAGGAEVMNRIAEMYAGDLQNAAKIFWVPKGVPVILFPQ